MKDDNFIYADDNVSDLDNQTADKKQEEGSNTPEE